MNVKPPQEYSVLLTTHRWIYTSFQYNEAGKIVFESVNGKLTILLYYCSLLIEPRGNARFYEGLYLPSLHCENITKIKAESYEKQYDSSTEITITLDHNEVRIMNSKKSWATIQEIYQEPLTKIQ